MSKIANQSNVNSLTKITNYISNPKLIKANVPTFGVFQETMLVIVYLNVLNFMFLKVF